MLVRIDANSMKSEHTNRTAQLAQQLPGTQQAAGADGIRDKAYVTESAAPPEPSQLIRVV